MSKFRETIDKSQSQWKQESPNYRRGCASSFLFVLLLLLLVLVFGCKEESPQPLVCNCGEVGLKLADDTRFYVMSENECSGVLQLIQVDSAFFYGSDTLICTNEKW